MAREHDEDVAYLRPRLGIPYKVRVRGLTDRGWDDPRYRGTVSFHRKGRHLAMDLDTPEIKKSQTVYSVSCPRAEIKKKDLAVLAHVCEPEPMLLRIHEESEKDMIRSPFQLLESEEPTERPPSDVSVFASEPAADPVCRTLDKEDREFLKLLEEKILNRSFGLNRAFPTAVAILRLAIRNPGREVEICSIPDALIKEPYVKSTMGRRSTYFNGLVASWLHSLVLDLGLEPFVLFGAQNITAHKPDTRPDLYTTSEAAKEAIYLWTRSCEALFSDSEHLTLPPIQVPHAALKTLYKHFDLPSPDPNLQEDVKALEKQDELPGLRDALELSRRLESSNKHWRKP